MSFICPITAAKQTATLLEDLAAGFGHESGFLFRDAAAREARLGTLLEFGDNLADVLGVSPKAVYERHLNRSSEYRGMVNPYNSPFKRQP